MAVEVRELIIKATITQDGSKGGAPPAAGKNAGDPHELIRMCVEKVLEIIKEKNGR